MNVDSWTVIASDKNRPSGPQSIMDTVVFTRKKLENTVMITNACIRITDGADFTASSSAGAASPEAAAPDEAPAEAAAPVGTLDNFSLPAAINSSTDLPSNSEINKSNFSDSTSIPTDSKTLETSAADGLALPAWANNK
ncbi:unnamed protein product [[Candida] boidinii]|nr:unnamed protein product [[Candida] boidinii]